MKSTRNKMDESNLFALLQQMRAKTLTMIPRDDNDQPLGLVVLVKDSATQEFLEFLESYYDKKPVKLDDYGWDT
jgi:hypothetical protein